MRKAGEKGMTRGTRAAARALLPLAVALLALGASACGSGSSPDSTARDASAAATAQGGGEAGTPGGESGSASGKGGSGSAGSESSGSGKVPGDTSASFQPRSHRDSGGGAAQFETKGGDNSIQESGSETSGGEFAQAAAALHDYLDARAAHAWAAACESLFAGVTEQLSQLTGAGGQGRKPGCAEALADLSAGIPDSALREAAVADAGSLRAEGDRGFLLFKGAHGAGYFVPMAREGGEWKVAAIAPSALG